MVETDVRQQHRVGRTGLVTAGVAAVVGLLSFLALPAISVPIFGAVPMVTLVSVAGSATQSSTGGAVLVIVAAFAAIATAGLLAGLRPTGPGARTAASVVVQVLSVLLVVAYVLPLVRLLSSAGDSRFSSAISTMTLQLIGFGYYLTVLALLVAFGAATSALRAVRRARRGPGTPAVSGNSGPSAG